MSYFFEFMRLPPEVRTKVNDAIPAGVELTNVYCQKPPKRGKRERIVVEYKKDGKEFRIDIPKAHVWKSN